jgi:hypothetical protein
LKMLQARFDWACSSTVLKTASNRPRPSSTGLSRIQHLTRKWWNFEFRNIRGCVHTAVIIEPSMWHSSAILLKAAFSPQVKECFCPKRENNWRNLQNGIWRLWSLDITYQTSKEKFKKQIAYPKG